MDLKAMLVKLAEEQADKMKAEAMGHLASDEFSDMLATKMNDKIKIKESLIHHHLEKTNN